jgi:hypothetical protein
MHLILALLVAAVPVKILSVNRAATPPRIDGRIEAVWLQADSIDDFVQSWPDEGAAPTERTVVYVMQDDGNLYVAFRCHAAKNRPVGQLYGMEEEATVYIDPMDSKSGGYFFKVYGSGLWRQGLVLDNGNDQDWSWDCVWSGASRLTADEFTVEMKIPYKSIRYKQGAMLEDSGESRIQKPETRNQNWGRGGGASEWGINFHRFIATSQENDFWVTLPEREGGNLVSNYGRLQGIEPRAQGYYFELFPEGFVRLDQGADGETEIKPRASLNLKWDPTPQTTVNATAFPDFAQIESDPYSFNISRYPTYLSEQRPFFVEGRELFRMSGSNGPFNPLNIFYSRRIGKAVAGEPVPIISGLKLTTRTGGSSFGALGAVTDQLADSTGVYEPRRGFAVLSGKTRLLDASNLGLLFSGTMARADNYNFALGGDWSYRSGGSQAVAQAAFSDHDGTPGWALSSGCFSPIGRGAVMTGSVEVVSDSFSVDDIGYVPWAGRTRVTAGAGPYITPRQGNLRRMTIIPSLVFDQEPGTDEPSYGSVLSVESNFRNGWGGHFEGFAGHAAEADTTYFGRSASASVWGASLKDNVGFGGSYDHSYNYARGFVAANYSDWVSYTYYLAGRVAVMLSANNWWECDPQGDVVAVTSVARPKLDFRINSRISFNVYDEIVLQTPETRFAETRPATNRVGCLFSWNFLPKSWLYLAFNDYRVDAGEGLTLASRVGAVKLRYLFYF